MTACLDRKQGERERQVLPLQAHGRKAAGSCSPQKQHLQLSHPREAPATGTPCGCSPPPRPKDVSHTLGMMDHTKLLASPLCRWCKQPKAVPAAWGNRGDLPIFPPRPLGPAAGQAHCLKLIPANHSPDGLEVLRLWTQKAHQEMMLDLLKLWEWWLLSCGIPAEPGAQLLPSHGYHC